MRGLPIVALSVVFLAAQPRPAGDPPVPADASHQISGLDSTVRVVSDRWGIPHVRAGNLRDLYFAWGFVTARDRLWQLESTRRGARGEMWEWLGNRALTSDGGAQLFELRERAERIWARDRNDPEVRSALERYAAGINAWIEECRSGRQPWPVEFRTLGKRPGAWRPEYAYLVLLAQGMLLDLDLPELDEAREIRERGAPWVEARHRFERDVTYESIPPSVAERLYGRPHHPTLPGQPFPSGTRSGARVPETNLPEPLLAEGRATIAGWLSPARRDPDMRASNVFAVGPRRTARGAPILANDPHLALGSPSPLHIVHLEVPGVLDVAGAAVPGMPLIVSGRNASCAWGITALGADVMDLYADTLDATGTRTRWQGGWAKIREADYTMRYRVLDLLPVPTFGRKRRYTPHGPVVAYDRKTRIALSVRWANDDEHVSFARLLRLERESNAAAIAADVRTIRTPTNNLVIADRDGHVIYQTVGALPRRGFEPPRGALPDDGRREWLGLIAPDDMPRWELGPDDFVVNGNNLPVGAPYPEPLERYEFLQDRAMRVAERLGGDTHVTAEDAMSVQNDVVSRAVRRYLPLLIRITDSTTTLSPRARAALDTLRAWDGVVRRDRVAPTLFRGWLGAIQRRSRLEGLPGLALAAFDGRAREALRAPGAETPERPTVAAAAGLESAITELTRLLGPDLASWRYGRAHRARFRHALAWRDSLLQPPPTPIDGDNSTVSVGRSALPWNPWVTHGPVWRHVVDLAVAESSWCVLPPGNAGEGRHARDLLSRWANHGYVPLYLDWNRAETAKESAWTLEPDPSNRGAPAR